MGSLRDLASKMRQASKNFQQNKDRLLIRAAVVTANTIIDMTPVDTGRAASNWVMSFGGPYSGMLEPYFPGYRGTTAEENREAAKNLLAKNAKGFQDGLVIYITNNVPYIKDLEDGTSRQAPYGMVDFGFLAAARFLEKVKILSYNGVPSI